MWVPHRLTLTHILWYYVTLSPAPHHLRPSKVRRKNEEREENQVALRKQMLQQQKDPTAVVEMLATNMGFWLLGEKVSQR